MILTALCLACIGLFLNAFFSGSETGFFRVGRLRLMLDLLDILLLGLSRAAENGLTVLRLLGLLRLSGRAPDGLFFELGLRPGAPPLVRYRAGDIAVPPPKGG